MPHPLRVLLQRMGHSYCGVYLSASTSIVNLTSSPSIGEPNLDPKLKSLRFSVPVAENPVTSLPPMPFTGTVGPSTSRVTLLVTPASVRSPITCNLPFAPVTEVDLKVSVGNFSTLKKSGDFK